MSPSRLKLAAAIPAAAVQQLLFKKSRRESAITFPLEYSVFLPPALKRWSFSCLRGAGTLFHLHSCVLPALNIHMSDISIFDSSVLDLELRRASDQVERGFGAICIVGVSRD